MAHTIVTIVGSLRKESFSLKIANAMAKLAPASLKLEVTTLHSISNFNQDLEASPPAVPRPVTSPAGGAVYTSAPPRARPSKVIKSPTRRREKLDLIAGSVRVSRVR